MPNSMTSQSAELQAEDACMWLTVPDDILMNVFKFLPAAGLLKAGEICRRWHRLANDEFLWRDLFYRHWKINRSVAMAPNGMSWQLEYRRLLDRSPALESEKLSDHTDQVLHVSFSHNGRMFATTSKDGHIRLWNMAYPVTLRHSSDMTVHSWKYTQFSQFNSTDTLLLVSGVHPGDNGTMGEIAVFTIEPGFVFVRKVRNKPYDIFGAWFDETSLLSGDLHWRGNLASCSSLWLSQAAEDPDPSVLLYKFHNMRASSVRTVMITDRNIPSSRSCRNSTLANAMDLHISESDDDLADGCTESMHTDDVQDLTGTCSEHLSTRSSSASAVTCCSNATDKLLIFTMGSLTYTPHQIGIKHVSSDRPTVTRHLPHHTVAVHEYGEQDNDDDSVDHVIELNGHIIGMSLAPDHRHLYVNSRAWPQNYKIEDPLNPPPIAQDIDIHSIDLNTMSITGDIMKSHKAFTSNEECFFIFLNVCDPYVASGAEDHYGYLWDRHYKVCLQKFEHTSVVNCVAFNPLDPETLVSVSDDFTIKVWRSRRRERQLKGHLPLPDHTVTPSDTGDIISAV